MRIRLEAALGIEKPTPGRVAYDPRTDNIDDMRERRIPPKRGTHDEVVLGDAIP